MPHVDQANPLVTFWGTRGSISTPGRTTERYGGNTPCVTILHENTHIILDAGTGIRNFGLDIRDESGRPESQHSLHLFLSHTHWDHIQGLPFFQPAYDKDTIITIYGSPYKEKFLASVLKGQMDKEYFPVSMAVFSADIRIREISEETIHIGEFTMVWQEQVHHPGGSVRYGLQINGKKIVYATDVELNRIFQGGSSNDEEKALAQQYLEFVHNADLLIADGQFTEEEYSNKVGWGHTSIQLLLEVAYEAQVRRLAIFHHDPQHSDKFLDEFWMENRSTFLSTYKKMDIFWAREGLTLEI
jgi:phosphoribosyl 1,2-cyclic phosphodiesterase